MKVDSRAKKVGGIVLLVHSRHRIFERLEQALLIDTVDRKSENDRFDCVSQI